MDLLIMAAGMGSRFGGLKQIEPIDEYGHFIIDYSIFDAIEAGFDRVVFVIKEENYDIFRSTVGKRVEEKITTEYVFQKIDNLPKGFSAPEGRIKPWGTAHAIYCAKDVIKGNFAIVNSDDFYGRDAYKTIAKFLKENKDEHKYAMAGYLVKNTLTENGAVKRGVCKTDGDNLVELVESSIERVNGEIIASPLSGAEQMALEEDSPVSMNMFGFTPLLFKKLESEFPKFLAENSHNLEKCEFLIPDVISTQLKEKDVELKVLKTTAVWQGVTYKEDKQTVVDEIAKLVQNGEYPEGLWK